MRAGRRDLLDSLARSVVNESSRSIRVSDSEGERLSRASVLRRGATGAASLSVGLWKAPTARSQFPSRGECFDACITYGDETYTERIKACDYALKPESLNKRGWDRILFKLRRGPFSFWPDTVSEFLTFDCWERAQKETDKTVTECLNQCRETCSQNGPCKPAPPPKPKPPQVPAPPSPKPGTCGAGDLPAGVKWCCPSKHGPIPCQQGCHKSGDGCCGISDCR